MTFADFQLGARIVAETMHTLLPSQFDSPEARVLLLAIGAQESAFRHRTQIGGPAHGYWQFEQGGGVTGVIRHRATTRWADAVCVVRGASHGRRSVYAAIVNDEVLACAFARLLLWTDPAPLPALGDKDGAWRYYLRTWRPGRPHPGNWEANYSGALECVPHAEVAA